MLESKLIIRLQNKEGTFLLDHNFNLIGLTLKDGEDLLAALHHDILYDYGINIIAANDAPLMNLHIRLNIVKGENFCFKAVKYLEETVQQFTNRAFTFHKALTELEDHT